MSLIEDKEDVLEELSKKSYEVVLPLEKNVSVMSFAQASAEDYSSDDSIEDDKDGRPICNTWNGKNYELHVLGHNQNPFLRHLKSFQVPEKVRVEFDPFSRADVNLKGENPVLDAFVVWSAKDREQSATVESPSEIAVIKCDSEILEISLSDSEDEGDKKEGTDLALNGESDTEAEIYDYIKSLKDKKRSGISKTGETLWYDEEKQTVRNLHSESISITNYGELKNQSKFGKRAFLFDSLTQDEKQMLVNNWEQN